jgi:hypothetical protein
MALYRAHFLDHGGNVFSVEDFDAEHDEAAKTYAAEVFQSTIGKGYEIWHGDRLVHAENFFCLSEKSRGQHCKESSAARFATFPERLAGET